MTPVVRTGGLADIDAAVAVWQLANTVRRGGNPVPASHEDRMRGYLAKTDSFLSVAEAGDGAELVGMALGMQALDHDGAGPPIPGLCHISAVFVHPDRWGHRVGTMLMQSLLAEGRNRGYERFQLWTHADNERALRLYEGLGFARSGREQVDDLDELTVHYQLASAPTRS